jgi:4-amino-4-deoxy-L-arabinose transferase-like glycosyltransferase
MSTSRSPLQHSFQPSALSLQHFVVLLLALVPYFVGLGDSSIWDANEAFYVETPREMIERGDYINPTFNYEPRINKPVLSYWIVAGFYHVFGVSPAVQRIPIAIGGIVLVAAAFFLARAASPRGSVNAGWWAAIGLAVSPRHLMFSRRIFIDIFISMFMALTLLFFALSERYPERRRLFLVLMYVCVGLGMLTKGPIAALLPGLVFAVYLAVHRELNRIGKMMIPLGILIVLAIVVPWYAALYQYSGWAPIRSFFFGENVARYMEGVGVNADRPFWWYLPVVFSDSFPWSIFLIPAAVSWIRGRHDRSGGGPSARIQSLLWIWILVIVGFFSLSAGKQDLYIYPIVPAVTALAGLVIARALQENTDDRLRIGWGIGVIAVILALGGVGFVTLFNTAIAVYVLAGSALVGVAATVGGAVAMLLARRRAAAALLTIVSTLVFVNWVFVVMVLPSFEKYKPAPGLAAALARSAGKDDLLVTYNVALPSLVYYLRRHIEVFYDHGPVLELLRSGRPLYLMVSRDDYERAIRPDEPQPLCRVSSQPTFDVKLRNVLARERLPEVLLLTNKCQ